MGHCKSWLLRKLTHIARRRFLVISTLETGKTGKCMDTEQRRWPMGTFMRGFDFELFQYDLTFLEIGVVSRQSPCLWRETIFWLPRYPFLNAFIVICWQVETSTTATTKETSGMVMVSTFGSTATGYIVSHGVRKPLNSACFQQFEGTWINGELKGKGTYYYGDHRSLLVIRLRNLRL